MLFKRSSSTVNIFGADVPEPRLFLDFLGFEKHVVQIREKRGTTIAPSWYDHAMYYIIDLPEEKFFGSGDEVEIPSCVRAPDYEFEIACLITKKALLKTPEEALEFFKESCLLTICNDWSARDIQKLDMEGLGPSNSKFIIGKSFGPKFIKASSLNMDANGVFDMELTLRLNGEERSRSNYQTIYHKHPKTGEKQAWSFPRVLAFLGKHNISVQPGYIIGSGTVGNGCIAEFMAKVDPKTGQELEPALYPWLKDGDLVSMEAKGLGVLENKVRIKEYAGVK